MTLGNKRLPTFGLTWNLEESERNVRRLWEKQSAQAGVGLLLDGAGENGLEGIEDISEIHYS